VADIITEKYSSVVLFQEFFQLDHKGFLYQVSRYLLCFFLE